MNRIWILIFIIFLTLLNVQVRAQEQATLTLSPQLFKGNLAGYDLWNKHFKNWKYHPGDDLTWADPTFDDSDWMVVDTLSLSSTQKTMKGKWKWSGNGWLRLKFKVDEALQNRPLALNYMQTGAAEIYLDGKLIHKYGVVGRSTETETIDFFIEVRVKIEEIMLDDRESHLLAVRYSNFGTLELRAGDLWPGFRLWIDEDLAQSHEKQVKAIRRHANNQFFFLASLTFTLLHLMLFAFYPQARENLYYAAFTGSYTLLTVAVYQVLFTKDIGTALWFWWIFKLSIVFVCVSFPRFLYALFYPKWPKHFWFIIGIAGVLACGVWYFSQSTIYVFGLLTFVEVLRVTTLAICRKKDGAWIIGLGVLAIVLTSGYEMLQGIFSEDLPQIMNIYAYGVLASMFSMSIYLARNVAKTNRNLETLNTGLEERVKQRTAELRKRTEDLEVRNNFIRRTFGRYLTDEIVKDLLDSPQGWKVGGETRQVTILMSDLRGFSLVAEGLSPERVVSLLNNYLSPMTDIIMKYEGTIDEFIGDGILAIFGAPIWKEDHAERAVTCAIEMQLAMNRVNEQNRGHGLPEVEMGIGVNTGEAIVGNIGSQKRAKYGVVGSTVNLTGRIESYTVGGQILISEETYKATEPLLKIDQQLTVEPKGVKEPIPLYEVTGISGEYNLFLSASQETLLLLDKPIPI